MKRNEFLKISGIMSVVIISSPLSIFSNPLEKECLNENDLHKLLVSGNPVKHKKFKINNDFIVDDSYPEIYIDGCEFIMKRKWFAKQPNLIFDLSSKGWFCNNLIRN